MNNQPTGFPNKIESIRLPNCPRKSITSSRYCLLLIIALPACIWVLLLDSDLSLRRSPQLMQQSIQGGSPARFELQDKLNLES